MNKDRRKELDRASTILDNGQSTLTEARDKFKGACEDLESKVEELTFDKNVREVEDITTILNAEELASYEKAKVDYAKAKAEYLEVISNVLDTLGVSDETDASDLVDLDIEDDLNSASSDISSAAE